MVPNFILYVKLLGYIYVCGLSQYKYHVTYGWDINPLTFNISDIKEEDFFLFVILISREIGYTRVNKSGLYNATVMMFISSCFVY